MNEATPKEKVCFFIAPIGEEGSEIRQRSDQISDYILQPIAGDRFKSFHCLISACSCSVSIVSYLGQNLTALCRIGITPSSLSRNPSRKTSRAFAPPRGTILPARSQ
jgi:hypothetical protein